MVKDCTREAIEFDGSNCPNKDEILNSSCRIRVLFGNDEEQLFTNTMIDLISFLESIPNSVVYDSKQRKFL